MKTVKEDREIRLEAEGGDEQLGVPHPKRTIFKMIPIRFRPCAYDLKQNRLFHKTLLLYVEKVVRTVMKSSGWNLLAVL